MYRDYSTAPLLDLRRRLKVVFDILGGIIREGFTLGCSFELTNQWSCILSAGPLHPVAMDDLLSVQRGGLGWFREVVGDLHARLSDLIHRIVVHRGDEAIRSWRSWLRENPLVRPYRWLRPDLVLPSPFLRCDPRHTPCGSGVLASPDRIDEEFRKAWLPYFCRSGQREASLEEFNEEVVGWLPWLTEGDMPPLTGDDLCRLFGVRLLLLVVWMVGVGGSLSPCLSLGLMVLLVSLLRLRSLGFGLRGCWMLTLL